MVLKQNHVIKNIFLLVFLHLINTSCTGTDGDSSNDNGTGDTDNGNDGDPIFTEPVFGDNDEDIIAQLNNYLCAPN